MGQINTGSELALTQELCSLPNLSELAFSPVKWEYHLLPHETALSVKWGKKIA